MSHNVLYVEIANKDLDMSKFNDYYNSMVENANKFSPFKMRVSRPFLGLDSVKLLLATESVYRFKFSFLLLPFVFLYSYWLLIPYVVLALFDLTQSRFGLFGLFWLGAKKKGLKLNIKILSNNEYIYKTL